jgi:predicted glycoside hydrolase/deacetylase ChbG (UPF0249 family)
MRLALRAWGLATPDDFQGEAGAEAYWTLPRFLATVQALGPGTTELMCHPGETPSHIQSGYAAQRRVELEALTSPVAKAALQASGVLLVDFGALGRPPF